MSSNGGTWGVNIDNRSSSGTITQFSSAGTVKAVIGKDGTLGIGTSSAPSSYGIHVVGSSANTTITNVSTASVLIQNSSNTNNNTASMAFAGNDGTPVSLIQGVNTNHSTGSNSGELAFVTMDTAVASEKMRITSSGNVGIGTTNPLGKLQVSGAMNATMQSNAFGTSSAYTALVLGNVTGATADNGGLFAIARKDKSQEPFTALSGWDNGSVRVLAFGGGSWDVPDSTQLSFYTAPAYNETNNAGVERMRITSGGSIGIGTSTPVAGSLVDMTSTTSAFMPPRMTTAQRDAINSGTFAAGMVIYNTTTNSLNYYNGTSWMTGVDFGSASAMAAGTDYQATAAGIVVAHGTRNGASCNLQGLTDAATTPTTVVAKGYTANTASLATSISFPVKSGNYYKVTQAGCTVVANFFPILGLAGSGTGTASQWNNNVNDINFTAGNVSIGTTDVLSPIYVRKGTTGATAALEGAGNYGSVRVGNANNVGIAGGRYLEITGGDEATANYDAAAIRSVGYGGNLIIESSSGQIDLYSPVSHVASNVASYFNKLEVGHSANGQGAAYNYGLIAYAMDINQDTFVIDTGNATHNRALMQVKEGGNTRMIVEGGGTGRVGIGTTTLTEKLEVNGNVRATSFISTSDGRLKENIQTSEGLELITKLRGVEYNWKSDGKHDHGVIAQEVEKVLPDAVVTNDVTGMKAVKYQNFIAPLIESVKALYNRLIGVEKAQDELARDMASLKEAKADVDAKMQKLSVENEKLKQENSAIKSYLCSKDPGAGVCK